MLNNPKLIREAILGPEKPKARPPATNRKQGKRKTTYTTDEKEKARQMYIEGTPPRSIAKELGIPESTLFRWTRSLPSQQESFKCEECGTEAVRKHPTRKYCSPQCKRRAKYKLEKSHAPRLLTHCKMCHAELSGNSHQQYCSKKCKNREAKRRERARK